MQGRRRQSARRVFVDYEKHAERYLADRLMRRIDPWRPVRLQLESPPSADGKPRYGYGRPVHLRIDGLLGKHRLRYRDELVATLEFIEELTSIPVDGAPSELRWSNSWLPAMDMAVLYAEVRRRKPRQYVEVGSGNSTLVARRAIHDGGLDTEIVSIDPQPRVEVDGICDHVVRQPLEQVPVEFFSGLTSEDLLFVDASHRVFMNSDMVAFYLDILPDLPEGMILGIHDILWPSDYLPEWSEYWFSEQYLLGAYLISGVPWIEPILASHYASLDPDLAEILRPLWDGIGAPGLDERGFAFWLRKGRTPDVDR
jgi:hypothetical protein